MSKPQDRAPSRLAFAVWFLAKVLAASALLLTAVLMSLISLMAIVSGDVFTALHLSLVAFVLGYVVVAVLAAVFAYLLFKSAANNYKARKRLLQSAI